MSSAAHDEFAALTSRTNHSSLHPEDAAHPRSRSTSPQAVSLRASTSRSPSPTMPSVLYKIPQTHFDANTGPKGVIADAQAFDRARKKTFRQTLFGLSNALGTNVLGVSEKTNTKPRLTRRRGSNKSSSDQSTSGEEDEDQFMRSWREKRMNELQASGREVRTRRLSPSKRSWGHLSSVDAVGYLDAVEKVAPDTTVVVLINDEESAVSGIVEDSLADVARKHEFVRFVKLSYQEAEMDPVSVPAVLAYKNGDLIANLVSVIDEVPAGRDVSARSLESVLLQHRIL